MNIEIMSPRDAFKFKQFMTPWVFQSKDKDKYIYYAAIENNILMGMLVMDPKEDEPEILSIAVSPDYCNRGVATGLLRNAVYRHILKYGDDLDLSNRFIACFPTVHENAHILKKLFSSAGFRLPEEGAFYTCKVSDIAEGKILHDQRAMKMLESGKLKIKPLKDIEKARLNFFGNKLVESGVFPGVSSDFFDQDVSYFKLDSDGNICSCMMFLEEEDGVLNNALAYMDPLHNSHQDLLFVFTASAEAIEKKFPPDAVVNFLAINDTSVKLIEKLIPNAKNVESAMFFELPFEDAPVLGVEEKYGDMEMNLVSEENMVCARCRYCQNLTTECDKYYQKPDLVLDGGSCELFEEKP